MKKIIFLCLITGCVKVAFTQQKDTLINNSGSQVDSIKQQNITPTNANQTESGKISFSNYFLLLGDDLGQDIISPFHQTGKSWKNIGIYAASITAFSFALDEPIQVWASNLRNNNKAVKTTSNFVTKFGGSYGIYTLGTLGAYSFLFRNNKLQTTTLLATQAYITSGLLETALKYITGRQRPTYYNPRDNGAEPAFHGPAFSFGDNIYKTRISAAFPSGHTTVSFAIATVFAKEYKNTPWVPVVAYSAASLIGLSRLTQNAHWATDVIAGATLGYLSGLQVVNNYHRHVQAKEKDKRASLSFNLNYNGYNFEPGLVYTFRH